MHRAVIIATAAAVISAPPARADDTLHGKVLLVCQGTQTDKVTEDDVDVIKPNVTDWAPTSIVEDFDGHRVNGLLASGHIKDITDTFVRWGDGGGGDFLGTYGYLDRVTGRLAAGVGRKHANKDRETWTTFAGTCTVKERLF